MQEYPESTEKLLIDLAASEAPDWIIQKAKAGVYNDYDSPLATPIIELVKDAEKAHLPQIAKRARAGAYDGTWAEGDAWMEREGNNLLTPEERKALGFERRV